MEFSDLQGQIDESNVLIDSDNDSDSDFAYASAKKKARQAKRADRRAKRQNKRAKRVEKRNPARAAKITKKADANKQKSQSLKASIVGEEGVGEEGVGEEDGAELESPESSETGETTDSATKSPKKLLIIGGIVVAFGIIALVIIKLRKNKTN